MVFSSLLFTFLFLPAVLFFYFIAKEKYRNYVLLAASLIFYAYGEPKFVFLLLLSILGNYLFAIWISMLKVKEKVVAAKWVLALTVALNLLLLFLFKYLDFSITLINSAFSLSIPLRNIALPIGISFFTFQALSYVIDVYRGTAAVQKNLLYLALYISFFPQLIAGPIVRYNTIEAQILNRTHSLEKFAEGFRRFLLGFSKKILLANNLAIVTEEIRAMNGGDYSLTNPSLLWLGSICFSLQIFFDFSGYSDMAIGLGKIFGFDFEENFIYPFCTPTVSGFWERWHISMCRWFRDYVYIPLGGSRVKLPRYIFNLFVVWFLTGVWHGASTNFIAWGLSFVPALLLEKYLIKPDRFQNPFLKAFYRILSLLFINFTIVMFNSANITDGMHYILGMLGVYGTPFSLDANLLRYFREYGFTLVMGILFSMPVCAVLSRWCEKKKVLSATKSVVVPVGYAFIFLWSVSFLILGTHNPFIYFNF